MPNVPIPLVGPTYTSRSLPVSAQITRNFYVEADQNSENVVAFQPFPGLKLFATTTGTIDRGMGVYNNELYKITDATLYKISSSGVVTSIGTIAGNKRCVLIEDTGQLVIATGVGKPYSYDGTTLTLGTDADLPNADSVTYIKNRVVYDGNNSDVVFADLGSPLSVNSSNIVASDTKPDDTLAMYAWKDQLFAFGENSIAPYYNTGSGSPPYSIIQNSVQEIGTKAIHSISSNNNALYFLGNDLMPYRLAGLQPQPIGNPAIGQAIAGYSSPGDAIGQCWTFHNQNFYFLSFPGGESWLFSESTGFWTNLSYSTNGLDHEPHLINSYARVYDKHLVADRRNGNVYELDFDTFTDNGDTIFRQRDTRKITGKEFGVPGKVLYMQRLEVVVETGTGLITGQGSDPQIMMQYSDDGGRTWSKERWKSFGTLGDFTKVIEWFDLGSFRERQFRFRVSDPVKIVLISANADIEVGV